MAGNDRAHTLRVGLSAVEYRTLMVLAEHAHEDGSKSYPAWIRSRLRLK